jgi:hypothetical protein
MVSTLGLFLAGCDSSEPSDPPKGAMGGSMEKAKMDGGMIEKGKMESTPK